MTKAPKIIGFHLPRITNSKEEIELLKEIQEALRNAVRCSKAADNLQQYLKASDNLRFVNQRIRELEGEETQLQSTGQAKPVYD